LSPHVITIAQALLVVFLWATSWVFVKIGLQGIPPVTFAGIRYFIAFLCLFIVTITNGSLKDIQKLPKSAWIRLLVLGALYYSVTQGAIFVALAYLPAVTVNLLWGFSSVLITLLGIVWLKEHPSLIQWIGIALTMAGVLIYFTPVTIPHHQWIGLIVAGFGILANAISAIMGRDINRTGELQPIVVTVISMGIGSSILLMAGFATEGIPTIDTKSWGVILWLALINTAFAFTLWNHTLRTLTAMESSIINGTMMIWIPIFAILFLGEPSPQRKERG
jgi:drug/metabolite transporter (DMT)-like permease